MYSHDEDLLIRIRLRPPQQTSRIDHTHTQTICMQARTQMYSHDEDLLIRIRLRPLQQTSRIDHTLHRAHAEVIVVL